MYRTTVSRPGFRLRLSYPTIDLIEEGRGQSVGMVDLAKTDFVQRMRDLAAGIARTRGRLVAELPEAEVWRGVLPRGGTAFARRRAARRAAAAALSAGPGDLVVELGQPGAMGETPVVATRRGVLAEARRFLARGRLRPVAIVAGGAASEGEAPLWQSGTRVPMAAAGMALAAGVAAVALMPEPRAEVSPRVVASVEMPPVVTVAPTPPVLVSPEVLLAPKSRPDTGFQVVAERDVALTPKARILVGAPMVTQGTRNMPELAGLRGGEDVAAIRVAERVLASKVITDAVAPPPARVVVVEEGRPMARPGSAAPVVAADARPRPRPGRSNAALAAELGAAVARASQEPVRVAALTSTDVSGSRLTAIAPPEPRPAQAPAAKPVGIKAAPVVVAKPVAQAPLLIPVRATPMPTPTPTQVARVQPVPQKPVAVVAPRVAPKPVVETTGLVPRSVSLLGVFGTTGARYALVRLPNGVVKRVRPGDNVSGARVAAISADSVRLNSTGGADMVLRMEE